MGEGISIKKFISTIFSNIPQIFVPFRQLVLAI